MKKERHPIDEFFRESLGDYQIPPSKESKNVFLKDAERILGKSSVNNWWFFLIPLILIIILVGSVIYYDKIQVIAQVKRENSIQPEKIMTDKSRQDNLSEQKEISSGVINMEVTNKLPITQKSNIETIQKKQIQEKRTNDPTSNKTLNVLTNDLLSMNDSTSGANHSSDTMTTIGTIIQPANEPASPDTLSEVPGTILPIGNHSAIPDTSNLTRTANNDNPAAGSIVQREWRLGTGIYFSPEWMFHTLEDTKFINNFGIEGMFRFGRYSIRTGAGLSISKGTNQLQIEYNDYLGSYMKLDSMTFTWDDNHYLIIPLSYYLTNKDVYDSLMKLEDAKIVKRYTYLQVPLILGYDFFQRNKISLGFRAGPILSVLLSEKTLSDTYDPGKKRIISINDITPEQVNLNWEIMVGFNATFRLSRIIGVEIEPYGKYYFNSVYQTPGSAGKPWSVGLRAAFFISFQ